LFLNGERFGDMVWRCSTSAESMGAPGSRARNFTAGNLPAIEDARKRSRRNGQHGDSSRGRL